MGQGADNKIAARRVGQAAYPAVDVVDVGAFAGRGLARRRVGKKDIHCRYVVAVAVGDTTYASQAGRKCEYGLFVGELDGGSGQGGRVGRMGFDHSD